MITHLCGKLAGKEPTRAVIDVHGVGYEVLIPLSTFDKLPREGEEIMLRTVHSVREDAIVLYGFATDPERRLFQVVTNTVSGVGPKIGLSILSCMNVDSFCAHVLHNDLKALSQINGVGKRTAERLVVELKDKIGEISPKVALTGRAEDVPVPEASKFSVSAEEAISGLVTLGIKPDAARKTIREIIDELQGEDANTQKLLRMALSRMNK